MDPKNWIEKGFSFGLSDIKIQILGVHVSFQKGVLWDAIM